MGLVLRRRKIMGDAPAGYPIERSLRFNAPDSPYLTRTPSGAATSRRICSLVFNLKRTALGSGATYQILFSAGGATAENQGVGFGNGALNGHGDIFEFFQMAAGGTMSWNVKTAAVYRDLTAHGQFVVKVDTTQATDADRVRIYYNGSEVAYSSPSYPSQNSDLQINHTVAQTLGRLNYNGASYLNGYLSDVHIIDGQALDASYFWDASANGGAGGPKKYTGTYGANGGRWTFADNSNTTAATLGADSSGNGNNFTPNNFSVAAGAGNDSLTDTPTNYGNDNGLGGEVRANYAVLNPLNSGGGTLSNGNLSLATPTTGVGTNRSTLAVSSGKWYWEIKASSLTGNARIGIIKADAAISTDLGASTDSWAMLDSGQKYTNSALSTYGASWNTTNTIGIALDMDAGTLTYYKDGVSQGVAFTGLSGPMCAAIADSSNSQASAIDINFGQRPFDYAAPADHKCLCTQNLPDPSIPNPKEGFEARTRTGTGAAANVTGLPFQPGLYIGKSRSAATDWGWYDSTRGATKQVESNTTTAETTEATGVTAFNADGISLGALAQLNTSAATYLDLFFRFGVAYGIGAVTYTGNGSNRTIAHPLGRTPKMIIVFDLTTGGSHRVYHASMAASTPEAGVLYLDSTAAYAAAGTVWNSTAPTSSVFSVGTDGRVNTSGSSYIAFVFAEIEGFSAFGSYIGNGSTDGTFIPLSFRPGFWMHKRVDSTGDWRVHDSVRQPYNPRDDIMLLNSNAIEDTGGNVIDFTAMGVKARDAGGSNTTSARYIYWAIADQAGKYARAA